MTKWLFVIGILFMVIPLLRKYITLRWPKVDFSHNPLMAWTAASLLDLLIMGFLIYSPGPLGWLLFPVILGTILGIIVMMGCLINWILKGG